MAQDGSQSASPCAYNDQVNHKRHMFTQDELSAIADLITFHDESDWFDVSCNIGVDVSELYDKVIALMNINAQG